jgi:ACR3 family arsenite transporter
MVIAFLLAGSIGCVYRSGPLNLGAGRGNFQRFHVAFRTRRAPACIGRPSAAQADPTPQNASKIRRPGKWASAMSVLLLYGVLGGWLLGVNKMPVPWEALLLSVGIYVALPLVAGYLTRRWIMKTKGPEWFAEKFLRFLTPGSIGALLVTLVLRFSFKGETILANPLTILWIAIPLAIQTLLIFGLTYLAAHRMKLRYEDAAPAAMIGASNHFEVAIATAVMLFGLSSGAALATVVGVLIEVPLMLFLVRICQPVFHDSAGG